MSRKRKPNNRRPGLDHPPTDEESWDIAATVYGFAELVADQKPEEAVDAMKAWVGTGREARLRGHYLAAIAPVFTMALIRTYFPVDMEPDDYWVMDHIPGKEGTVHTEALAQVIVRHLNDDPATAEDLLNAHLNTHGNEGLFWFGVEATKALAGVILYAREQETDGSVSSEDRRAIAADTLHDRTDDARDRYREDTP